MQLETFLDDQQLQVWNEQFNSAQPFRFVVIDNFLEHSLAHSLAMEFPGLEQMKKTYHGLNEHKAEHSGFDTLHPSFSELKRLLSTTEVTKAVEQITGFPELELINDRYGYGLHQGGRNSFLDIHVDYNLHPKERKLRRLNLILFLNEEWKDSWGGALELWDKDMQHCIQKVMPVFNRCVLFECHDHSFHGYSTIKCPEHITRKSFYQYYFSTPPANLRFHDTIFRNRPNEPATKKLLVTVKERVKNSIKRVLYTLRLLKLLK